MIYDKFQVKELRMYARVDSRSLVHARRFGKLSRKY